MGFAGVILALGLPYHASRAGVLDDFTFDRWCTEIAQKDAATCARHTDADVAEYKRVRAAMSRMEQEYLDEQCKQSSQPDAMKNCRLKNYEIDPNPPVKEPFGNR
jgi:hypothetical protein